MIQGRGRRIFLQVSASARLRNVPDVLNVSVLPHVGHSLPTKCLLAEGDPTDL